MLHPADESTKWERLFNQTTCTNCLKDTKYKDPKIIKRVGTGEI